MTVTCRTTAANYSICMYLNMPKKYIQKLYVLEIEFRFWPTVELRTALAFRRTLIAFLTIWQLIDELFYFPTSYLAINQKRRQ